MALKAIQKTSKKEYIPKSQRDTDRPATFTLKALDYRQKTHAGILLTSLKDKSPEEYATQDYEVMFDYYDYVLQNGIDFVKNIDGYEWNEKVDKELMEIIVANDLLVELATEIMEFNSLGGESKNSKPQL